MCNRLGIYVFYDKDGIVDDYVTYFLNDLKTVVTDLIVIVNGDLDVVSEKKLRKITQEIIIRENEGYEMKAYEYVFLKYLSEERMDNYSELVMCNNSFYGPFIHLKDMFNNMKNVEADYWGFGITSWGYFDVVPSFFVVYRFRIIQSHFFEKYFNENRNYFVENFFDVVALFEYGICGELRARGYKYADYVSYDLGLILELPDRYICDYHFPILKRKTFTKASINRVDRTLEFLKENNLQWFKMINTNINRQYGSKWRYNLKDVDEINYYRSIIRPRTIIDFIVKNEDIYIYGAGILGKKVFCAYRHYFMNFKGFIVSNKNNVNESLWGHKIYELNELPEKKSIIVALSSSNTAEVRKLLFSQDNNCLYLNV